MVRAGFFRSSNLMSITFEVASWCGVAVPKSEPSFSFSSPTRVPSARSNGHILPNARCRLSRIRRRSLATQCFDRSELLLAWWNYDHHVMAFVGYLGLVLDRMKTVGG